MVRVQVFATEEGHSLYFAASRVLRPHEDGVVIVDTLRLDTKTQVQKIVLQIEPLKLPTWALLKTPAADFELSRIQVQQELAALAVGEAAKLKALLVDRLRPLEAIEVQWGTSLHGGFLGVSAAGKGEAKLALSDWLLGSPHQAAPSAEFALRSTLQVEGVPGMSVTLAVACVVRLDDKCKLRIDQDDLNFSFPEFEFPTLDLSVPLSLPWPTGMAGASRVLSRLAAAVPVDVHFVADPVQPALALDTSTGALRWALVKDPTAVDWNDPATLAGQLANFKVEISSNGASLKASNITVAQLGDRGLVTADAFTGSLPLLQNTEARGTLGPIQYVLDGLTVTAKYEQVNQDKFVWADVEFDRLELRLIDDPQTVLAFKGHLQVTQSGARVLHLELIEPYPIQLIVNAANALVRGAQAVATFLGSLQRLDASRLQTLLAILGKFAAAMARAAMFVGNAIADAAAAAASAIGRALGALAEALASLLAELPKIAPPGGPVPDLNIEVRLALDPIELRQVLITQSSATPQKLDFSLMGLHLDIEGAWLPGLLLDFVDHPGAYLVLTRGPGPDTAQFATLGTDLWLGSKDARQVSHMPDADPVTGNRPDKHSKRLIEVISSLKQPGGTPVLVVAGVRRGEPLFLKRLVGDLQPLGAGVSVLDGRFSLIDIDLDVDVKFETNRLLPLLGMGETGDSQGTGGGFLDKLKDSFNQVVWVERFTKPKTPDGGVVKAQLQLGIQAAKVKTHANVDLELNLNTLQVQFDMSKTFPIKSKRIEEDALGLTWIIEQADDAKRKVDEEITMFQLSFVDGESGLSLSPDARMELRFKGLSSDGEGIVFKVSKFFVGRRGVDITATVSDRAVRLNGLDVPFRFQSGSFSMRAGRLVEASVSGRGTLPPALVGDAECTLALAFTQEGAGIVLQSGKVEIDKKGEPIVCHSTRFTLTISDLDVGIQKEDGAYHFYFLVTGSVRFTPKEGEFEGGLLGFLSDIEINLERTPLTGDARVLAKHISFQKALNPKKSFPLFNLFTFELRGFGFHPSSPRFDGEAAINISGQIKFAEIGDVMQPKIDFHGLWIAAPKPGEALPRISAEGLGIDLQLSGAVKIRGSVLAVDPQTRTVEGKEFAPEGYNTYGFLGEGEVEIPGWGCMQASLGFLEVERKDSPGDRRKAFFIYLQKDKLAVKIPTGFWTFYMREAGFGFGFRYTLAGIKEADDTKTAAQLIRVLDDVSKRQGDLSRYSAWSPDPEGDRFTLALRAAIQAYPAKEVYDDKAEASAENPFLFDVIVALRSDLTLLASMRGYLGVNYADFRANKDNFRENPGLRGYLYISAPRSELLARMIGDSKGFIGERFPGLQTGQILRKAVQSADWSATLYIRPGLFHYELGWPNQLAVRLADTSNMKVTLRGGMIFRAADDGLLWGYNIEADAWMSFGGSTGGSVGVAVEGELQARFVARLLAYLSWRFQGSMVYGLVMLDASLRFRVRAWMEVDLGFKSFTIRISFSFSVQFSAAIELAVTTGGVGGRGHARIAVSAFGCTLGLGVGFAFNDDLLDAARLRVQRFMAMSITADEPDTPAAIAAAQSDQRIDQAAAQETLKSTPVNVPQTKPNADPGLKPDIIHKGGTAIPETHFWLVLYEAPAPQGANVPYAYALLVPRQDDDQVSGFYASPPLAESNPPQQTTFSHELQLPVGFNTRVQRILPDGIQQQLASVKVQTAWGTKIPVDTKDVTFTLEQLFDECFLTDTKWVGNPPKRISANSRKEPEQRRFTVQPRSGLDETSRTAERDLAQKQHAAEAAQQPADDRAHQARSTVMAMFLDQFVAFAKTGKRPDVTAAHVLDLGLVFHGPVADLELLAGSLQVTKHDAAKAGEVRILNPLTSWFTRQNPLFERKRIAMGANGLQMDWDLSLPWKDAKDKLDPEHYLHHYEICRTIEGHEYRLRELRIKPSGTMGGKKNDRVAVMPPDWQFTDDFSDLPPQWRQALLPTQNEADAVKAATAWIALDLDQDVTFTYSVTPVDIAGSRGLSKSFVFTVDRPALPVRAAQAEVRIVQMLATTGDEASDDAVAWEAKADCPAELEVYIALRDPAWTGSQNGVVSEAEDFGDDYRAIRSYVLIVEQDHVLPAGSFGSDGLTDRLRGVGKGGALTSRLTFDLKFEKLHRVEFGPGEAAPFETRVRSVEPDEQVVKQFPFWGILNDRQNSPFAPVLGLPERKALLDSLWAGRDTKGEIQRVAARFWLRTRTTVIDKKTRETKHEMLSEPVSIPCELSVLHQHRTTAHDKATHNEIAILRPEAFEWPVHLRLPPLVGGQVRTRTGFLHARAPSKTATLAQWVADDSDQPSTILLRDAQRRTLTQLEFDAVPQWAPEIVKPTHVASIAGFDVHELDIDDLAPLDTGDASGAARKSTALGNDRSAWKRARRVAHVELLSPEAGRLVPASNADWLGWQAHYPSETWRVDRADKTAVRKARNERALPARRAWFTARESMPRFPERTVRERLLPLPLESAITDLMKLGKPMRVVASLEFTPDSPAAKALSDPSKAMPLRQCPPIIGDTVEDPAEPFGIAVNGAVATYTKKIPADANASPQAKDPLFSASDLRYLLLCLRRPAWESDGRWPIAARSLDGVQVKLVAHVGPKPDQQVAVTIPVDFQSMLHPILEEVTAELALARRDTEAGTLPAVYRGYTVMLQAPPAVDAGELANYLAGGPASVDPYGWGVLQGLGLATTLRMFDTERDSFVPPRELASRANRVFARVLKRWKDAGLDRDRRGQPFAEVLLRPGRDRTLRPFDAKAHPTEVSHRYDVDDEGLAMLQLSLRPSIAAVRQYYSFSFTRDQLEISGTDGRLAPMLLARILDKKQAAPIELLSAATLERVELDAEHLNGALTLAPAMLSKDGSLRLWVRCTKAEADIKALLEFKVDPTATASINATVSSHPHPKTANDGPCPFELFDLPTAEQWASEIRNEGSTARRAFDSLQLNLEAVAGAYKRPDPKDPAQYKTLMAQYPEWAQRFLDHCAYDDEGDEISLALAAPTRSSPWRVAADKAGAVRLSIPSEDRWAHAKAYAVKPVSRYAHLLAGVGISTGTREQLVTPDVEAQIAQLQQGSETAVIGNSVAVTPRTERIEPPVILGSSVQGQAWEIAVARHGEESLAMSNRPLFARLGKPDLVLAQLRSYRVPTWPEKLHEHYNILLPQLYPGRKAERPRSRPKWQPIGSHSTTDLPQLSADRLAEMSHQLPALWKGADLAAFRPVPPQYKVLALAAARAGVVVSNISAVVQDDLPRKALRDVCTQPGKPLLEPVISVRVENKVSVLDLTHRLVSHQDVTPDMARDWAGKVDDDVCWWPDPDVSYSVLHIAEAASSIVQEELSDTRLVAEPGAGADPVIVRARGTRWNALGVSVRGQGGPLNKFEAVATFALQGSQARPVSLRLEQADLPGLDLFAAATERYAAALVPFERTFLLARTETSSGTLESHQDYAIRIRKIPAECKALADQAYAFRDRFDLDALTKECLLLANEVAALLAANDDGTEKIALEFEAAIKTPPFDAYVSSKNPRLWPLGIDPLGSEAISLHLAAPIGQLDASNSMLVLWDLPDEAEANAAMASLHPLAQKNSRFWQAVVQRFKGNATRLELRAVDARASAPEDGASTHPGVARCAIALPAFVKMV